MNIRIITLAIVTLLVQNAWAQNTFKAIVKDGKNKEILIGVNAVLNKTTNGQMPAMLKNPMHDGDGTRPNEIGRAHV